MPDERLMRDALLERVCECMGDDPEIFILSDDMGAPVLDKVRTEYKERFINVGIAEQNLINVSTGLAMEGKKVFAYGISPFFMRAYEQIRVNLAIMGQMRPLNVTMVGVGCGVSYDVSGPTHHCLEDLSIMRTLPNIEVISPCDYVCAAKGVDYTLGKSVSKYIRLDGKKNVPVYDEDETFDFEAGFKVLREGEGLCLLTTGYMTRQGLEVSERLAAKGASVGVIDLFMLQPLDRAKLFEEMGCYDTIFTLEEAFIGKGGLDALALDIVKAMDPEGKIDMRSFGFPNEYLFEFGARDYLYEQIGCDAGTIETAAEECLKRNGR